MGARRGGTRADVEIGVGNGSSEGGVPGGGRNNQGGPVAGGRSGREFRGRVGVGLRRVAREPRTHSGGGAEALAVVPLRRFKSQRPRVATGLSRN